MSDLPPLSPHPEPEATPLAHRFDASYPEVPPVPSATRFETEADERPAPPDARPETVVAAGSALAVVDEALAADEPAADEPEEDDPLQPPDLPPDDADRLDLPASDLDADEAQAAVEPSGALAGAAPGDSEAILALLEVEAFSSAESLAEAPPDEPEENAAPADLPEQDAIPAFERLEPPPDVESSDMEPPDFAPPEAPSPDSALMPAALPEDPVELSAPSQTAEEPPAAPVGPHFRTDLCPRCGQPDFSKGALLSYGPDFRPTYYKPAGLSWRRLRSMLRPFRHLVEVEAQVCRHCGLVSLQVDTDVLNRIEDKFDG